MDIDESLPVRLNWGLHCGALNGDSLVVIRDGTELVRFKLRSCEVQQSVATRLNEGCSIRDLKCTAKQPTTKKLITAYKFVVGGLVDQQLLDYCIPFGHAGESLRLPVHLTGKHYPGIAHGDSDYAFPEHTYLRNSEFGFCIESPNASMHLTTGSTELIAMLLAFFEPCNVSTINSLLANYFGAHTSSLFKCLLSGGMLQTTNARCSTVLEFHDSVFHAWSRHGSPTGGFGSTFARNQETVQHVNSHSDYESKRKYPVLQSEINNQNNTSDALSIQQSRRSIWSTSGRALTGNELAGLLATVFKVSEEDVTSGEDKSRRLYPSGGALYETAAYVTMVDCESHPDGIYRYDPDDNSLLQLDTSINAASKYLSTVGRSWGAGDETPRSVITLVSDASVVVSKYEAMAYRLMLLNVGVILQTITQVAALAGLAGCVVTCVDPLDFERIAQIDGQHELVMIDYVIDRCPQSYSVST